MASDDSPILHLVVIGFHHKKGYQVSERSAEQFNIDISVILCVVFVPFFFRRLP